MAQAVWAIGLMSGTSRDGVDAALIRSDGRDHLEPGPFVAYPYTPETRLRLAAAVRGEADVAAVTREITDLHADAVHQLLETAGLARGDVAVVGFHGHTLHHDPLRRRTHQIGDGRRLAALTGIDVVHDFRRADIDAGGQGAPLAPLYHWARTRALVPPLAVLNLGGVGNVSWIGADGALLAFDTGPGNALLDDLAWRRTGHPFDADGALAGAGRVHGDVLDRLLAHRFFDQPPPKSLDRDAFDPAPVDELPTEDAAATLAAFTAHTVGRARPHLPAPPARWLVSGGGRHNPVLMRDLREVLAAPVDPVEAVGWNGDALEAEAFAYLALRSRAGLPLSLPGTTGVPTPTTGGVLCPATG
jgi:anhydro-N-acetylmuramic acid kinase